MASVPNLLATEESVVEASIIAARYRRPHRVHPAYTPSSGWCWRSGGRDSGPAVHKPYEEARMDVDGYLVELFGRLPGLVHAAVEDLDEAKLAEAPADGANTIAWLVWHLTRIEDHHLSEAAGTPQRYIEAGWHARFGRGADPQDPGYGHSPAAVASVRGPAADLAGHHHPRPPPTTHFPPAPHPRHHPPHRPQSP